MLRLIPENVKTVLCLGCHADDIEIGCGGTLLRLLREHPHLHVWWVVLSGEGSRREEAQHSAEAFLSGAAEKTIIVEEFRDRFFPYDGERVKKAIHDLAQRVQPDIVFTHRREDLHQDHRTVAEITWNAFRNHMILEYEIPKYEGDLGQPNVFVPLESETCRRKVDLLLEHFPSQRGKPWFDAETFQALLRFRGLECNSPSRFAEAFHSRKALL